METHIASTGHLDRQFKALAVSVTDLPRRLDMKKSSTLFAALALVAAGTAFAQGNPPTTASPNPATAAGQQSPAGGPMGTTGTTPQNKTASGSGSGGTSGSAPMSGSMSTGSSNDTNAMAPNSRPMRPARADRN
jgi:hypothetical protein